MTQEYYFKNKNLMIWYPTGTIDIQKISEFVNFIEKSIEDGNHNFMRFIDLSKIKGISVNHEEIYSVASGRRQFNSEKIDLPVKLVFYVTSTLSFGMARMYENMLDSERYDIRIFYILQEVAEFLDVNLSVLASK